MIDFQALDNPIWCALNTGHRSMARRNGLAARYPGNVSPLAGLHEPSPQAFSDLRALVSEGEKVALFTTSPIDVPDDWEVSIAFFIDQMVCESPVPPSSFDPQTLGEDDVPEMLALTAATEPGPFLPGTIQMGSYFGVRAANGHLAAMTGQRLRTDQFTEVSAVCTSPEHRGNGYAQSLVAFVARMIQQEGSIPFLHVKTDNDAKRVYERVGFRVRCPIQLTVLSPKPPS